MGACCKSCALKKPCETGCPMQSVGGYCPRPLPDGYMNQPSGSVASPRGFLAPNMGLAMQLGVGGTPTWNPMRQTAPAGAIAGSYVALPNTAYALPVQPKVTAVEVQQTDIAMPLGAAYLRADGNPLLLLQAAAAAARARADNIAARSPLGMGGVGCMGVPRGVGGFSAVVDGLDSPMLATRAPFLGGQPWVNPSGATKDEVAGDASDATLARRPANFTEADWAKLSQADRQKLLDSANAATLQAVSDGLKTGLGAASAIIQAVINSNDSASRDKLNLEIEKLKNNANVQLEQIKAKRDTDIAAINAQVQTAVANGQITAAQAFDLMKQAQAIQQGTPGFFDTTAGKVAIGVGVVAVAGGAYWLATRNDGARKNPEKPVASREAVQFSHTDYFARSAPRRSGKRKGR